jgi:hypothetical protein
LSHIIETCRQRQETLILLGADHSGKFPALTSYATQHHFTPTGALAFIEIELSAPESSGVTIDQNAPEPRLRMEAYVYSSEDSSAHEKAGILVFYNVPRDEKPLLAVADLIRKRGCNDAPLKKDWLLVITLHDPSTLIDLTNLPGNPLERAVVFRVKS